MEKTPRSTVELGGKKSFGAKPARMGAMVAAALGFVGGACGPMPEGPELEATTQAQTADNGFAMNGFAMNGFTMNGFVMNGFAMNGFVMNGFVMNGFVMNGFVMNGFTMNGTETTTLAEWFNEDDGGNIAAHWNFMKYLTRCALGAHRTVQFTDKNAVTHTWTGGLGLADAWAERAPTAEEQQMVSACMMSHVNNAEGGPKHIQISLRGTAPSLQSTALEKAALSQYDGTFFGNVFSGGERFVCSNTSATVPKYLETVLKDWGRQCYQDPAGCGIFQRVDCATSCTRAADGTSFESCSVNGKSYKAITVYIPQSKLPRHALLSGTARGTCTNCVDGQAIDKLSSKTSAKFSLPLGSASGDILLEVRYANGNKDRKGNPLTTYASFTMGGKAVLNGASANWDFPYTGGSDVWATKLIPVSAASGDLVVGGTSAGLAPRINVVSIRLP